MTPQLPPHWGTPVAAAAACVICGAIVEAAALVSPIADQPTRAWEISFLSGLVLHYASIATEMSAVAALTLIAGLVLVSQRLRSPEAKLLFAMKVTAVGFSFALILTVIAFLALFVIPGSRP